MIHAIYLLANAEKVGFTFWNADSDRTDFRDVDTIECHHNQLANVLWERMKDHIGKEFDLVEENYYWQSGMFIVCWIAVAVAHCSLLIAYCLLLVVTAVFNFHI